MIEHVGGELNKGGKLLRITTFLDSKSEDLMSILAKSAFIFFRKAVPLTLSSAWTISNS